MFFLNLDFLTDDYFLWDGQLDPFLQVASHYLEGKREQKVCLKYLTEERDAKSLMHQNNDHIKGLWDSEEVERSLSYDGQQKHAHMLIQRGQRES